MAKKLYYKIDNGDTAVICNLKDVTDMIDAEASDYDEKSNERDMPQWNITLVFLTDEEFSGIPDA